MTNEQKAKAISEMYQTFPSCLYTDILAALDAKDRELVASSIPTVDAAWAWLESNFGQYICREYNGKYFLIGVSEEFVGNSLKNVVDKAMTPKSSRKTLPNRIPYAAT